MMVYSPMALRMIKLGLNAGRVGPLRAVQSGAITPAQMRKGIAATAIVGIFTGMWLICEGLAGLSWIYMEIFLMSGFIASIGSVYVTTQVDRLKNVGTVPRTVRNAARLGIT